LSWSCCCRSGFGRQFAALSIRWLRLCWDNRAPARGSQSRYAARCRGYQHGPIHAGLRRTSLAPIAGPPALFNLAHQSAIAAHHCPVVSVGRQFPSLARTCLRFGRGTRILMIVGRYAGVRPHYSRALGFTHWAAGLLNPPAYEATGRRNMARAIGRLGNSACCAGAGLPRALTIRNGPKSYPDCSMLEVNPLADVPRANLLRADGQDDRSRHSKVGIPGPRRRRGGERAYSPPDQAPVCTGVFSEAATVRRWH
jgi:hypothetical protein